MTASWILSSHYTEPSLNELRERLGDYIPFQEIYTETWSVLHRKFKDLLTIVIIWYRGYAPALRKFIQTIGGPLLDFEEPWRHELQARKQRVYSFFRAAITPLVHSDMTGEPLSLDYRNDDVWTMKEIGILRV